MGAKAGLQRPARSVERRASGARADEIGISQHANSQSQIASKEGDQSVANTPTKGVDVLPPAAEVSIRLPLAHNVSRALQGG